MLITFVINYNYKLQFAHINKWEAMGESVALVLRNPEILDSNLRTDTGYPD